MAAKRKLSPVERAAMRWAYDMARKLGCGRDLQRAAWAFGLNIPKRTLLRACARLAKRGKRG